MVDKNGRTVELGMKVIDIHGNIGKMVNVSGTHAIKFDHKGNEYYAFPHRVIESQIEIMENQNDT